VRNRATGAFDAIKKYLPEIPMKFFVRADSGGLGCLAIPSGYCVRGPTVRKHWPFANN
jgi:hypothetical protein